MTPGFQRVLRTIAGLCTIVAMCIADPHAAAAQVCEIPDAALALAPPDPPAVYAYDAPAPEPEPLFDVVLGVGHAYHAPGEPAMGPPGDNSWLQRVALPLSDSPGREPSAWIARGWIVEPGLDPKTLTIWGLLETGYEERSFVVLERRNDGWLRIRYARDERGTLSAWVPECALDASPAPLAFAPWSEWLLGDDISPLFVRAGLPLAMHTEPSRTSSLVAMISIDDGIEPHETRGEWMRVTLVQPSDFCRPEAAASTRREGWVRWLTEDGRGPRLWYFTRGC